MKNLMSKFTLHRIAMLGRVLIGLGLLSLAAVGFLFWFEVHRMVASHFKPGAPEPTAADAARIQLDEGGVLLTIKQRSSAWLPGATRRLYLDDITAGQVLVSITDVEGHVLMGPKSVRAGERFVVDAHPQAMEVQVVRLKNFLVGDDFGEFRVRRSTTEPKARDNPHTLDTK